MPDTPLQAPARCLGTQEASGPINETGDAEFKDSGKAARKAYDQRLKKIIEDRYGLDSTRDLVRMKTGREKQGTSCGISGAAVWQGWCLML